MEFLFGLDAQLLFDAVLLAIAVFVLFTALSYLLFEPARKMLEQRKERIKNDLETAKADKEEAARLKAEYESKLQAADAEVENILSDSRRRAVSNEEKILDEAHAEAARIKEHAKKEAALEKERVQDDMKKEMIALASAMAGKVVSKSMDTSVQDSLIEETLKEMSEETWQNQ